MDRMLLAANPAADVLLVVLVLLLLFFALRKVIRDKKSGRVCSSCPENGICGGNCSCGKK